jgi:signal transduction histidine kinase
MVVAVPITRGGDVVGVMVTVSPTDRLSHRVLVQWAVLGAVGCALLVACAFAADRLARWVLRPVQVLARATDEVATGRLAARVAAAAGPPELRRLATSFNTMADYVQSASEHQRAFVADASHQLRNPLAALLIRLDDVADRAGPGLENDARRAMDEGKRLAGILERLLELARSEQSAAEIAAQPVEPVVAERVSAWSPIARSRRISMHVEHQPGLRASMDAIAVAGALDVLLDNALKFSPESSRITVTTARTAGQVVISVRDEGPGLTPDELPRAGDRFWRSRTQQNVAGYGLGLSIARALLEPGQGRLEIVAPERGGLDVRLVLPAVTASNAGTS